MSKILVVDDDTNLAKSLGEGLEEFGHEVSYADSGDTALKALEDKEIDVVISDIEMPPGMSGIELVRAIRTRGDETPVMLMTGR